MPENDVPPVEPPPQPPAPAPAPVEISTTDSNHQERADILRQIGENRNSQVMLFVTGDRPGMETQIGPDVVDLFVEHLDELWPVEKISLILYTRGGNSATAWEIINLLRIFCDELEIIVISKAHSAGTLMCLGANKILMTKQATMGPIDPSLNGPLNPQVSIDGGVKRVPVSVEAVQGFLDVAESLGINDSPSLSSLLHGLSDKIHPLVLGQIYRTRTQIRGLAKRLLINQGIEDDKKEQIISFLCSESGSHDHTINRREAKELGLAIENPSDALYQMLRSLSQGISKTLNLGIKWSPDTELAGRQIVRYLTRRGLLESCRYGSYQFVSEGTLRAVQVPQNGGAPATGYQDNRTFEGWKRET